MAFIFTIFFYFGFAASLLGVFSERCIVMGRLGKVRGKKIPLAYTQKARYKMLENYKIEYGHGQEDIWYKFLLTAYSYSTHYMWLVLSMGVLALIL